MARICRLVHTLVMRSDEARFPISARQLLVEELALDSILTPGRNLSTEQILDETRHSLPGRGPGKDISSVNIYQR